MSNIYFERERERAEEGVVHVGLSNDVTLLPFIEPVWFAKHVPIHLIVIGGG